MRCIACLIAICLAAFVGCTGDVKTKDDSVELKTEIPKVEIGDEDVDLNPKTDGDVDIDTPAPGDN